MPVAVWLVFITVTYQCNGASSPERLKQAQSELLPMVLDQWVAPVDTSTFLQFRAVAPDEFSPGIPWERPAASSLWLGPKLAILAWLNG
jgi:hypothetical protein